MNEAAILAARRNLQEISKEEIADALERIIAGGLIDGQAGNCGREASVWFVWGEGRGMDTSSHDGVSETGRGGHIAWLVVGVAGVVGGVPSVTYAD